MLANENDALKHKILELMYEKAVKNPNNCSVQRQELISKLSSFTENFIDLGMLYLAGKKLVKIVLWREIDGVTCWDTAVITADGMDALNYKEKFSETYPFLNINLQTINGVVYGNAVQAVNSQISFSQQVNDAFNKALNRVEAEHSLSPTDKEKIRNNLEIS